MSVDTNTDEENVCWGIGYWIHNP